MTTITPFAGINEIGGNQILISSKGTKVFLDFGMPMGRTSQVFDEFLQPRKLNGMGDYFEFDLMPRLEGLYRKDYTKHMDYNDDHKKETQYDAVILSHAHIDHCGYIPFLRPEIPIYCTEATKLIMQTLDDTGNNVQYLTYKENFRIYENRNHTMSRANSTPNREEIPREFRIIQNGKKFNIDSIEVLPIEIDHSLPGVCGFIISTPEETLAYTADIRFHGRRKEDSEQFVKQCKQADLDHLLCEGTRIHQSDTKTEFDVENSVKNTIDSTEKLVVCAYPPRDLDRLLSFYNAAKETDRLLVIDMKQAYLLKLFEESADYKNIYPRLDDKNIRIFLPRKSWGLVNKDQSIWTKKILLADYGEWERPFLDYSNAVTCNDVSSQQKEMMFYCSDYQLQQLIDIKPETGSNYIRSSTEPFNDEMILDQERVKKWLIHFGLISNDQQWITAHVSGHGSTEQIQQIISESNPKNIIPIHTEHPEIFTENFKHVTIVNRGDEFIL